MKLLLKAYDVSESVFDEILERYESLITTVSDLYPYKWGYKNKNVIYYNGLDELIIKEMYLDYVNDLGEVVPDWKQCVVRKVLEQKTNVEKSITGTTATAYINEILRKYYTNEEINDLLNAHTAEYDFNNKQYHFLYPNNKYELLKFSNCVYYDINGAHLDALSEIFPKAKKDFTWMYNNRKKSNKYKKIPNFYVGNLCNTGHRPTYNWIVQRTNEILLNTIEKVGGQLVYANTDGFVAYDVKSTLMTSKTLGSFKLEAQGDVYLYSSNNYFAIQYNDVNDGPTLKGNVLKEVRNRIDLEQGKVVSYDRVKEGLIFKAINIKESTVQWQKV